MFEDAPALCPGALAPCSLCLKTVACPKPPADDSQPALPSGNQCALHSALVFVIVDYLWTRVLQG
jgi:hypothetical protein